MITYTFLAEQKVEHALYLLSVLLKYARAKIIMKNGLCLDSFWSYECHVLNSIIIINKKTIQHKDRY